MTIRQLTLPLRWLLRAVADGLGWAVYGGQRLVWLVLARCPLIGNQGGALQQLIDRMGIVIFVGPNGSGKSLAGVDSLLPALAGVGWECSDLDHEHSRPWREHQGSCEVCAVYAEDPEAGACAEGLDVLAGCSSGQRLVYSTLPLLDADTGQPHQLYRPLTDYRQLVTIEHADVFFDEVAGVSDASDSSSTPAALTRWLQQLRKRDVRLRVTTPAYKRCSLSIRQVAQCIVDCRAFFPSEAVSGRLWRPNKAMIWKAYDGFDFNDFDKSSGQRQTVMARRFFWRPGCRAERSYNTLAQVLALADVTDAGMCMACGGTRSRPKCACDGTADDLAREQLVVVETVTAGGTRSRKAVPKSA